MTVAIVLWKKKMICQLCKEEYPETFFPLRGDMRGDVCAKCLYERSHSEEKSRSHVGVRQLAQYIRDSNGLSTSELCDVYGVSKEFIELAKKYKI